MMLCEQSPGQSVLEHGESVWRYMRDIISHLRDGTPLKYQWRLPEWVETYKSQILEGLVDDETLELYATYHDCGKPFCRVVDDQGKVHFPDHAGVSYETWKSLEGSQDVGNLILHDMFLHTASAEDLAAFCKTDNKKYLPSLLISALSEVHSNASMFGGIDSQSFKIKWKHLDRRGRALCKLIG